MLTGPKFVFGGTVLLNTVAALVWFGGFGSCAVAGNPSELNASMQIDALVDSMAAWSGEERTDEMLDIRVCFAVGSSRTFMVSNHPSQNGSVVVSSQEEVLSRIANMIHEAGAPTFVFGQSHGGTMATRLAARLDDADLKLLYTVDPISIEECGPMTFTGGLFGQVLLGDSSPGGCRGAPAEFMSFGPDAARHSDRWVNSWQSEFAPLHSGHVAHADENVHWTDVEFTMHPMGAHASIDTDPEVWRHINSEVQSALYR
jgi:hypothetical protein